MHGKDDATAEMVAAASRLWNVESNSRRSMDPIPQSIGPYSAGLPMKIEAAESKSFYFPYTKDCFLKQPLVAVGVNDTYHRLFWCRRSDMKRAIKSWRKDFADFANCH